MKHNIGIPSNKNEILGADFSLIREKIKTSTIVITNMQRYEIYNCLA